MLQGTAVSSECTSQCPPGNVAALGSSLPLRRSPITPEVSLERLIPLEDFLAAWKLLPNISKWVLQTVERGYRIQIGSPPPRFNGVVSTVVGPEQALVLEQEVIIIIITLFLYSAFKTVSQSALHNKTNK